MTGQFGTETEVMEATRTKVGAIAADLQGRVSTLRGQIEATRGMLEGNAANAFRLTMADWDTAARNFQLSVQRISDLVGAAGTNFRSSDTDGAQTFTGAGGHIGRALGGPA